MNKILILSVIVAIILIIIGFNELLHTEWNKDENHHYGMKEIGGIQGTIIQ